MFCTTSMCYNFNDRHNEIAQISAKPRTNLKVLIPKTFVGSCDLIYCSFDNLSEVKLSLFSFLSTCSES